MANETKEDIAADRDRLADENAQLKAQVDAMAAAGPAPTAPGPVQAQHTFLLSEGERQELVTHGVVAKGGKLMTRDEVLAKLGDSQRGIDLGDGEPDASIKAPEPGNVRGVDYVWPSVSRGEIDPAVAGTPGISGPAADDSATTGDPTLDRLLDATSGPAV